MINSVMLQLSHKKIISANIKTSAYYIKYQTLNQNVSSAFLFRYLSLCNETPNLLQLIWW